MNNLSGILAGHRSLIRCSFFYLIFFSLCASVRAAIIYVKPTGNDSNTGATWDQAYKTIQKALSVAGNGDNIWVAIGAYYPDEGPVQVNDSRDEAFYLKAGVSLLGGFNGTETMLNQRDPQTNTCILSGDIQQDGEDTHKSRHVIIARGMASDSARINGFLITHGNADSGMSDPQGGGMRIVNSRGVRVTQCVFLSNQSSKWGGALSIDSSSTPQVSGCGFYDNTATHGGGAISVISLSQPTFLACIMQGNLASTVSSTGGGAYILASTPEFYSCTFSGNYANVAGGIYSVQMSPARFFNCTFSGNASNGGGGAIYNNNSNTEFVNSIFWDNVASGVINSASSVVFNLSSSPTFEYCLFPDSLPVPGTDLGNNIEGDPLFIDPVDPLLSPQIGGDFTVEYCSPVVDQGDSLPNVHAFDAAHMDRIQGNNIDLGAYELQDPVISWTGLGDGLIWDNEANWSTMVSPPSFCQGVLIPAGSTVQIGYEQYGFGGTLTVDLSAELEVVLGGELLIDNAPIF